MTQRPDIVLHVPAEDSGLNVAEQNIAVFALKLRATRDEAKADFAKLEEMCSVLNYQLAVFINIDSTKHFGELYSGAHIPRIHAFAVKLIAATPLVNCHTPHDF